MKTLNPINYLKASPIDDPCTRNGAPWKLEAAQCFLILLATIFLYPAHAFTKGVQSIKKAPIEQTELAVQTSPSTTTQIGSTFKDCTDCPEMVVIPAGSFTMGSNDGRAEEKPPHTVTLRSFALGKYEVTQGQWKALMGRNPSSFKDCGDNCPVENVSWEDAQQYIQKLNQKTGQRYRLPSEAEWEYACRAGSDQTYCGSDDVDRVGVHEQNSRGRSTVKHVGSKPGNAWGLHDMSGNVWEWVQDVFHSDYNGAPQDGSAWEGGGKQRDRVLRGGSWVNDPYILRATGRNWDTPDLHYYNFGFRLARMLP